MTDKAALDFNHKYKADYCIPLWLRDLQIKQACKRVSKRFRSVPKHDGRIAVAAYGPSLRDTWQDLRRYPTIMTCSGAHSFLIERSIIPTYHAAVDPLPGNTVKLIGQPHPDVEYLIASTCHADVFDLLEGYNVSLWHILQSEADAVRVLPRGEPWISGGCDVGMRCLTLAGMLGFRKIDVYGMDGSYPEGSARHAGTHPVQLPGSPVEYKGKTFFTTSAMLTSAKMVFHELDMLPGVDVTFHGEGLVQEMAKHYIPNYKTSHAEALLAIERPEVISKEYVDLNRQLHESNLFYGCGGDKYANVVLDLASGLKTNSILDYGCGKGRLAESLPFPIWEYDPAVPGKDQPPRPADIVVCTDVLEHIEPEKLNFVLDDIARVMRKTGFFVIHQGPSSKTLPDGRNTHLIQKGATWWQAKLEKHFTVGRIWKQAPKSPLLFVVVEPKGVHRPVGKVTPISEGPKLLVRSEPVEKPQAQAPPPLAKAVVNPDLKMSVIDLGNLGVNLGVTL